MAAQIEYDSDGGISLYFFVAFWGLLLLPVTYFLWPSQNKKSKKHNDIACYCPPCRIKTEHFSSTTQTSRLRSLITKFILLLAWVIFILLVVAASKVEHTEKDYDPFQILKVDRSATESEIKRAYHKLSLKHHPDKEGGDSTMFMLVSKAYAALTDPESRKNWEEYGNPDGPTAATFGIALPAWLVSREHSLWVLLAYVSVFLIALPITVGIWWYRSVRYNGGEQVLVDTTRLFYHFLHKTPSMNVKCALKILGSAFEFDKQHNPRMQFRPSDELSLRRVRRDVYGTTAIDRSEQQRPFSYPHCTKARLLITAQMARLSNLPSELASDQMEILKHCPSLIREMISVFIQLTVLYRQGQVPNRVHHTTLESLMKLSQCISQGISDSVSPLKQLPHLTEQQVRALVQQRRTGKVARTLQQLASLKEDDRRAVLNFLDERSYLDVTRVLASMPSVSMIVSFHVDDDEDYTVITAGSVVTLTVVITRKPLLSSVLPMGEDRIPSVDTLSAVSEPLELEDEPPLSNGDINTKSSPKPKKNSFYNKKSNKKTKRGSSGKAKSKPVVESPPTPERKSSIPEQEVQHEDDDVSKADSDEDSVEIDDAVNEMDANSNEIYEDEDEIFRDSEQRREMILETKNKEGPLVHCPYFPEERRESWWVFVLDSKRQMIRCPPTRVQGLIDTEVVKLQLSAPDPGRCQLDVVLKSDSYVGLDIKESVVMTIEKAKKVEENHPQWDFSDEDEKNEGAEDDDEYDEITDDNSSSNDSESD